MAHDAIHIFVSFMQLGYSNWQQGAQVLIPLHRLLLDCSSHADFEYLPYCLRNYYINNRLVRVVKQLQAL